MRNLLLLSAVVAMAACSDNQQPTAPTKGRAVSATESASGQIAPSPQAKPSDQVGFTTVTYASSNAITIAAGQTGGGAVNCPTGTIAMSGGYVFNNFLGTPPVVTGTRPVGAAPNPFGWTVSVSNQAAGAAAVTVTLFVVCVS